MKHNKLNALLVDVQKDETVNLLLLDPVTGEEETVSYLGSDAGKLFEKFDNRTLRCKEQGKRIIGFGKGNKAKDAEPKYLNEHEERYAFVRERQKKYEGMTNDEIVATKKAEGFERFCNALEDDFNGKSANERAKLIADAKERLLGFIAQEPKAYQDKIIGEFDKKFGK